MRDAEHREGVALMRWAEMSKTKHPCLQWLHHIPNGGRRSKATAGRLKAEGVKKGVSDYHLPYPCGGRHGLYIELKAPAVPGKRQGQPTKEQKQFLSDMRQLGYMAEVAVGWQQAKELIETYLAGGQHTEARN